MNFLYRPYVPDDLNFIRSSWGSSYYKGGDFHEHMSAETFHFYHRPIRDKILARETATIIVCANPEFTDQIIGWIAVEEAHATELMIVHYCYVKKIYKGEGIAAELFKRAVPTRPVYFSHMTDRANKILMTKTEGDFYYAPHLI